MDRPRLETLFLAYRSGGDAAALARVFDLATPQLRELARRLASDPADAEDLLQETFVTAIERRAAWDEREPLLPWLVGILAVHSQRRRRERARVPDPERLARPEVERPDEVLAAGERRELLMAAIAALRPEERSLVQQRLLEGWSPAEMARELELPSTTLRMRLSRALARLRRRAPSGLSWVWFPELSRRAAVLLALAAVGGTIGVVACLAPEKQPQAQAQAQPPARPAVPLPQPQVITIGAPPAEGEIAALPTAPDAPRKRVHFVVVHGSTPIEGAHLLRLFPDAGFEGYPETTDASGRLDADIVEQGMLDLAFEARSCKRRYVSFLPADMHENQTVRVELVSGPEPVRVRFVLQSGFPQGFLTNFVSLALLGDRRPEPDELEHGFLRELLHRESLVTRVLPDGTAEAPILPGRYWVWARAGSGVNSERPDLLPCCFEVEIPEGHDVELPYAGTLGGALVLEVRGQATIGMDVEVSLADDPEHERKLWFRIGDNPGGVAYAQSINVGTPRSRSEPIPAGEHVLVFRQRGKELERRKVTIERGQDLALSISP